MVTPPGRSFLRDVLVNVVANLVAAAVVYLAAVMAGLLWTNVAVMIAAGLVAGFVLPILVLGRLVTRRTEPRVAWLLSHADEDKTFLVTVRPPTPPLRERLHQDPATPTTWTRGQPAVARDLAD